jgi:disulfide oxidoreductase YuzD
MNKSSFLPWIFLFFTATLVGSVSGAAVDSVTIQFVNPAKFTDFSVGGRDANFTAQAFASSIRDELAPIVKQKYPNGSLVLRFTDIDLAGNISNARNARIIRPTHPARMNFEFRLTDSNGKVLANGNTRVNDSSSMSSGKYDPKRRQSFYYERRALNRWLRTLSVAK